MAQVEFVFIDNAGNVKTLEDVFDGEIEVYNHKWYGDDMTPYRLRAMMAKICIDNITPPQHGTILIKIPESDWMIFFEFMLDGLVSDGEERMNTHFVCHTGIRIRCTVHFSDARVAVFGRETDYIQQRYPRKDIVEKVMNWFSFTSITPRQIATTESSSASASSGTTYMDDDSASASTGTTTYMDHDSASASSGTVFIDDLPAEKSTGESSNASASAHGNELAFSAATRPCAQSSCGGGVPAPVVDLTAEEYRRYPGNDSKCVICQGQLGEPGIAVRVTCKYPSTSKLPPKQSYHWDCMREMMLHDVQTNGADSCVKCPSCRERCWGPSLCGGDLCRCEIVSFTRFEEVMSDDGDVQMCVRSKEKHTKLCSLWATNE